MSRVFQIYLISKFKLAHFLPVYILAIQDTFVKEFFYSSSFSDGLRMHLFIDNGLEGAKLAKSQNLHISLDLPRIKKISALSYLQL